MLDWLYVLLDLWLGAGALCFLVGIVSAIFSQRSAPGPNPWILPFYLLWMLPIFFAIYFAAAIWWIWEKLFKSAGKRVERH
jgi:hypothetical protein